MHRHVAGLSFAIAAFAATPAVAQSYPAQILFKGSETAVGETIAYPTTGKPVVTAAIVTLMPGEKTVTHRHGVPMFAHILEGEITVDYGSHGRKTFKAGQSLLEAMTVAHAGMNLGTVPVRLIAVYMGAEGAADVVPEK
jgi:quercetin dioxygenase-like cupin family protein